MLSPENFFRDGLESVLKKMGRTGVRFHAFRRFREATLQKSEARQLLIDYWDGCAPQEFNGSYRSLTSLQSAPGLSLVGTAA
jgi:hypothetical protein